MSDNKFPTPASDAEVQAFLDKVASMPGPVARGPRGRLIFALDATASRQPTWDRACELQAQMFLETAALGGLDVQLVYYRGFREFEASPWLGRTDELLARMTGVSCLGGLTQIERVLTHAVEESRRHRVDAVVFVGDCVEERVDRLCHRAGELGLLGVPVFVFQEGREPAAEQALRQIARLSHGAWCPFDAGSARQLRELLTAVAVYAAGGRAALEDLGRRQGGMARLLTHRLDGER